MIVCFPESRKRKRDELGETTTVYVEGLPFAASAHSVQQLFAQFGSITGIRLPRFQDSGRLLGYGHIDYKTQKGANAALNAGSVEMGRRYVTISAANNRQSASAQPRAQPKKCATLFVKNLSYDTDESAVRKFFR